MSDLEPRIAEVLVDHRFNTFPPQDGRTHCACGWDSGTDSTGGYVHRKHVAKQIAALLAPALAEAKVTALREAAEEVGAWGPACIPAARALVNRANTLENQ